MIGIDDGVILNVGKFPFHSMKEVVSASVNALLHYLENFSSSSPSLVLGGWSYGGVVALLVAYELQKHHSSIILSRIILFDSPLWKPLQNDDDHENNIVSDDPQVQRHFNSCTTLLNEYYETLSSINLCVSCPIIDFRASQSTYSYEDEVALQQFSTSMVKRTVVPGNHWTILSTENFSLFLDSIRE